MDDPSGRSRNKKKSMRKFFGRKNNVTEEDVISMVHEGRENGVFLSSEARMIKNVFEFDEKDAKDIMIHRNNITALDGEITEEDQNWFRNISTICIICFISVT